MIHRLPGAVAAGSRGGGRVPGRKRAPHGAAIGSLAAAGGSARDRGPPGHRQLGGGGQRGPWAAAGSVRGTGRWGEGGGCRGTGQWRAGRRWGPREAGEDPGRWAFRAMAGAQGGGGGVCECVSVGGHVCA
ncbi:uncharacterized protein [Miscanthus floridulus]|uniref:uncharacterized protein n=1 Tax=Miscanthus floridulus TaxID=154761 RepID=UPI0034573F13